MRWLHTATKIRTNTFPEFSAGDACFKADGLGHPLLPSDTYVGNDIDLPAAAPSACGRTMACGCESWKAPP